MTRRLDAVKRDVDAGVGLGLGNSKDKSQSQDGGDARAQERQLRAMQSSMLQKLDGTKKDAELSKVLQRIESRIDKLQDL